MSPIIAINVALLPDEVAREAAIALNARLRENYPAGFALGGEHLPHVTLAQAFVRENDLEAIWQKIEKIPLGAKLRAEGFDFFPRQDGLGSSGFDLDRPPWLLSAQQEVEQVLKPFVQTNGSKAAFFRKDGEPEIGDSTLDYVRRFFSAHSGRNYNPHITLGRAYQDFLEAIRAEPFEGFDVIPAELGIYQLGNHGTCRKVLRAKDLS